MSSKRWPALAAARQAAVERVPFCIGAQRVGSVARAHLPALQVFAPSLAFDAGAGVLLQVPAAERDAVLAQMNQQLREQGLIQAWRNELYALRDPQTLQLLAQTERAAARFWGTLTQGAHATGYVCDEAGRPAHLWIAQRAFDKDTDPGRHDNLIGGGVPLGQTALQTLVREGFEEAGLAPHEVAPARAAGVLAVARDIPQGFQHEWLHSFDLELPATRTPLNQDGEVAAFTLLPLADALALVADASMTVDAALVTLDFALRHALLHDEAAAAALQALRVEHG